MVDAVPTDVRDPCRDPQATDTGVGDSGIHGRWPGAAVQAVAYSPDFPLGADCCVARQRSEKLT
jgi:hypothetical protein